MDEQMSDQLFRMMNGGDGLVLNQHVTTAGRKMSACAFCTAEVLASGNNRCGGCRRVAYCSEACQTLHWYSGHKKACKALASMTLGQKKTPAKGRTWKDYVKEKKFRRALWLAGKFDKEAHLQAFLIDEPYCCHCFRIAAQVESAGLRICPGCGFHNFCADCSQTHDDNECSVFRLVLEDEKTLRTLTRKTLRPWISTISDKPSPKYKSLASSPDWYALWGFTPNSAPVPAVLRTEGPWSSEEVESLWRLNSDNATNSYTMLAALEKVFPDVTDRKTLTLHILGAGNAEIAPRKPYESILHELPSLEHLEIFFIGPKASNPASFLGKYTVCQHCSKLGKTLNLAYWPGLYHDFVKSQLYTKPDLAAAYHSGFPFEMEIDSGPANALGWLPTIRYLLKASHPTVFTSMNKDEMVTETIYLQKLRAHFIQKGELNKWRSIAPINEGWYRQGVFYRNYYWYIIGPKK